MVDCGNVASTGRDFIIGSYEYCPYCGEPFDDLLT